MQTATHEYSNGEPGAISRAAVVKVFLALIAASLLLRVFYAGHLYQDDGLWFTTAEEMLRGKALYREIYFDKPPALPLFYALAFKLFGAHILAIRMVAAFYAVAVAAVICLFGVRLYDRRTGLLAAAMFTIFSTTYTTGHVQGLNTDFLMALPYTAGAYLLTRSLPRGKWLAFAGGALTSVAFQTNPKAVFNLFFLAALLLFANRRSGIRLPVKNALTLFALAAAGFIIGSLPFLGYIASEDALSFYWRHVWVWGARYSGYHSASEILRSALYQSTSYFILNITLFAGLIAVAVSTFKTGRQLRSEGAKTEDAGSAHFRSDVTLLIWLAASYAGMSVGGRFFGHYFFQVLPPLCLIAARGAFAMAHANAYDGRAALWKRRTAVTLLALGFAVTMVRFHGRTAVLAFDWVLGAKSEATRGWFHERLNSEERRIAAVVTDREEGEEAAEQPGAEALRGDGPRVGGAESSADYLFVWGYRPEIYYWSGLLPASRYLSTQPLTGVPADVHYFGEDYRVLLEASMTNRARAELVQDLKATRPKYIVDELGAFNPDLSIEDYPDLKEVLEEYKYYGDVAGYVVYKRRDARKKG